MTAVRFSSRTLLAGCLVLGGCRHPSDSATPVEPPSAAAAQPVAAAPASFGPVQVEMRNVHLHLDEGIAVDIDYLRGEMRSRTANQPPNFDDPRSYFMQLQSAEMWMDMTSLGNLMNHHVFAYDGAPLSNISVRVTDDGRLEQKATLHKGVPVPVAMKAAVGVAANGHLRLHVESERALGVPTTGLLQLFGLKLEDLVDLKSRRGIAIDGNDIELDPGEILPPPQMRGQLARVELVNDRLHQVFGSGRAAGSDSLAPQDSVARNYVYFRGETLRFGKLTMRDADLQLIDADPRNPFDFFPARYSGQLIAGYSKNTPNGGLRTYMPDFGKGPVPVPGTPRKR
jgi:hypothetical protein